MAWKLAFRHDANGTRLGGNKDYLIEGIENGASVKIIVNVGSYLLSEIPNRIWISDGHIFASTLQYFYNHKIKAGNPKWNISTTPWVAIWGTDGKERVTKPESNKVDYLNSFEMTWFIQE